MGGCPRVRASCVPPADTLRPAPCCPRVRASCGIRRRHPYPRRGYPRMRAACRAPKATISPKNPLSPYARGLPVSDSGPPNTGSVIPVCARLAGRRAARALSARGYPPYARGLPLRRASTLTSTGVIPACARLAAASAGFAGVAFAACCAGVPLAPGRRRPLLRRYCLTPFRQSHGRMPPLF